ncbi:MAG: DUF3217 domain-containing protein [Mycoplasmataceae bacterium]|nr:DUF3217 domain-containing protein [Mycoplasmataceae bacterium]
MESTNLINKVIIEGDIVRGSFGSNDNPTYFCTIKQERNAIRFKWINYFSIYALPPLANHLAKIVADDPHAHIIIEGELRTHISKKSQDPKTSILVNKIVNVSTNNQTVNEKNSIESIAAKSK